MSEEKQNITLTEEEAIGVLKEINVILISLRNIGSYYASNDEKGYESETTRFIDDWKVTSRLASLRTVLTGKFDLEIGDDDMDLLEREMGRLKYWEEVGD
ncbi:MAG: hypothetical protein ACSHYA_01630 [Opitutaceae bacterium]